MSAAICWRDLRQDPVGPLDRFTQRFYEVVPWDRITPPKLSIAIPRNRLTADTTADPFRDVATKM